MTYITTMLQNQLENIIKDAPNNMKKNGFNNQYRIVLTESAFYTSLFSSSMSALEIDSFK